eukprot:m51a1_g3108 hypothetical protein (338) ;mRNA; r:142547-143759
MVDDDPYRRSLLLGGPAPGAPLAPLGSTGSSSGNGSLLFGGYECHPSVRRLKRPLEDPEACARSTKRFLTEQIAAEIGMLRIDDAPDPVLPPDPEAAAFARSGSAAQPAARALLVCPTPSSTPAMPAAVPASTPPAEALDSDADDEADDDDDDGAVVRVRPRVELPAPLLLRAASAAAAAGGPCAAPEAPVAPADLVPRPDTEECAYAALSRALILYVTPEQLAERDSSGSGSGRRRKHSSPARPPRRGRMVDVRLADAREAGAGAAAEGENEHANDAGSSSSESSDDSGTGRSSPRAKRSAVSTPQQQQPPQGTGDGGDGGDGDGDGGEDDAMIID